MRTTSQILFGLGYPQSSADLDVVLGLNSQFKAGGGKNQSTQYQSELSTKRKHAWYRMLIWVVVVVVAWLITFKSTDLSEDEKHQRTIVFWTVAGFVLLWLTGMLIQVYAFVDYTMHRWVKGQGQIEAGGCAPNDWKCIWRALL